MLHNYLVTGLRALTRNRVFALINILGLAIGMAACILLLLFVRYETSFDQWLPDHERAYQIQRYLARTPGDRQPYFTQSSAYVVGRSLAKDFPADRKARLYFDGEPVILQNGEATTAYVAQADPEILDIVKLPLRQGRSGDGDGAAGFGAADPKRKRRGALPGIDPIGKTLSDAQRRNHHRFPRHRCLEGPSEKLAPRLRHAASL